MELVSAENNCTPTKKNSALIMLLIRHIMHVETVEAFEMRRSQDLAALLKDFENCEEILNLPAPVEDPTFIHSKELMEPDGYLFYYAIRSRFSFSGETSIVWFQTF